MTKQIRDFECPSCNQTLHAGATFCGCGWTKGTRKKGTASTLPPIPGKSEGISQCAWIASGEQCHYPGTISHNTQGLGPWYCRFHAEIGIGSAYGQQVVVESRTKPLPGNPDIKGCQEVHCVRVGHPQPNGRYLCYEHCKTPDTIEYARPPLKRSNLLIIEREPGQDG